MIYLDSSATTPIDPEVSKAMWPYLNEEYGNPSSKYYTLAENAKRAVEEARGHVASLLSCQPNEIIFTSCATESNNFVLKGVAHYYKNKGKHIITSKIEHKSILETCKFLESEGFEVTYLDVDQYGQVQLEALKDAIREDTILISIMWGNNEIGTLNNIEELAKYVKEHHPYIFFHTDATQVLGKIEVDLSKVPVDFLSLSAHKMYGPKGIGACFIRKRELGLRTKITPLLHGGSQEDGYRSGTLSVHNIVGLGKAAEVAKIHLEEHRAKLLELEEYLVSMLKQEFPDIKFNGHPEQKIPGVINFTIPGINNELIIRGLKDEFAISTGSACSINEPSYVLGAIGLNALEIKNSFRISLNKYLDKNKIDHFIQNLKKHVERLTI
ncbi:cysteine desulfurase [Anoxybacillus flavithermus]|uniref:cysteine desulfurase n=1 Tax=Anoxybacillus flavithermus TaxID=33934 RepID=A0A2G5RMM0_9BACL|nr:MULTISPECIES: cysteine desulfurase family protein [Anoxybacillus]KFZ42265.1 cysteine desulfurase [Anoxybacillus sp. KU2-6(11)]PIC03977.1 cysteine desulfurase [Anoxybacillus flavithermus]